MGTQKKFIDITGQVFGRLKVLNCTQKANRSKGISTTKFLCECECGNIKEIARDSLISGATKSCGCLCKEINKKNFTTHGQTKNSKTYMSWRAMKERCNNINNKRYNSYGGKGITVCLRWEMSFENFLEDMGERPEGFTLDRIDPNGGYSKDNCRWADLSTQAYNKCKVSKGSSTRVGVSWSKTNKKWVARIRVDGKELWLGSFENEEDAIASREDAEIKYRGFNLK